MPSKKIFTVICGRDNTSPGLYHDWLDVREHIQGIKKNSGIKVVWKSFEGIRREQEARDYWHKHYSRKPTVHTGEGVSSSFSYDQRDSDSRSDRRDNSRSNSRSDKRDNSRSASRSDKRADDKGGRDSQRDHNPRRSASRNNRRRSESHSPETQSEFHSDRSRSNSADHRVHYSGKDRERDQSQSRKSRIDDNHRTRAERNREAQNHGYFNDKTHTPFDTVANRLNDIHNPDK